MPSELLDALAPLLDRFQPVVRADPKLRQQVITLGRALITWADAADPRPQPPVAPPPGDEPAGWMPQEPAIIAARCRMKGEAAKLLARKHAGTLDDSQFQAAASDLRAQAEKLPKCALWMLDMMSLSRSALVWDDLVGGYTTAATAADLVQAVTEKNAPVEPDQILQALNLAAEAQSLLFSAVIDTGNPRADADQIQLYVTVRECATARGIYIHRYLRREDRVDPRTWAGLLKRVTAALDPLGNGKKQSVAVKKVLANLRFKLKKALADGLDRYDEWPRVVELLDEAMAAGALPTHAELHELLLPIIDDLPEHVAFPATVNVLLRELDKALAAGTPADPIPFSPEVADSLPHLRSQAVVLVGGAVRSLERKLLEQTFALAELAWLTGPEYGTAARLEPVISRPATGVVLFAVRWATVELPEVERLCAAHAKRLVKLPGGYHPNAVARQILRHPAHANGSR